MRLRLIHALSCAALFGAGLSPLHADTLTDHFVFHYQDGNQGTQDVTFDLPSTGAYPTDFPYDINIPKVQGIVNGTPTTLNDVLISSTQEGGGLSPDYKGFHIILYGDQLYTYADDPTLYTFRLGTFSLYDPFSEGKGTVTITPNAAAAVTPEPSTLLLLGTGLLGPLARTRSRRPAK